MPFRIIRDNIINVASDAIVNSANPKVRVGSGTDTAIYDAVGEERLLEERKKIGEMEVGQAEATPAFSLPAKYIIHVVGPKYIDGKSQEDVQLRSCYVNCLKKAEELGCESIAFPLLSSGSYGYPKDLALNAAMEAIGSYLLHHDMDVTLVVFDRASFSLSRDLLDDIESYIDDHAVMSAAKTEYRDRGYGRRPANFSSGFLSLRREEEPEEAESCSASSIEEALAEKQSGFRDYLFRLIDERNLADVEVYKKANIDRKVFSKIKCNENYHPKKKTALAFAIALQLDLQETRDLLARAGFALSPADKGDLIIQYFISTHQYDMMSINAALFQYDQPMLTE